MKNIKLYLGLLVVSFLWGTSFAAVKIGLVYISQTELVLSRLFLSAMLFALILFLLRNRMNIWIEKKDFKLIIWLAFCGITSYFPLQTWGVNNTITLHTALIMATSPIFAGLMGALSGTDRMSWRRSIGIMTAFLGVATIILGSSGSSDAAQYPNMLWGDLAMLVNAVAWAHFTIMGRRLMVKYQPFVVMAYIFIIGAVLLIPYAWVRMAYEPVDLGKSITQGFTLLGVLVYLGGLCAVYSYYMWYRGVQVLGAVNTSVFMYINPIFAMVAGVLLLGETLTWYNVGGGLLVLFGVYTVNKY